MSNFLFLKQNWTALSEDPIEAEKNIYRAPMYTAMLCRKSLEAWTRWVYEHDSDLELPYDTSLNSLLYDEKFKALVKDKFQYLNLIRKLGNTAVHTKARIQENEALYVVKLLHGFTSWVVRVYSQKKPEIPVFDESLIPRETGKDKTKEELKNLELKFHEQQTELKKVQEELEKFKAAKENYLPLSEPIPSDITESETRNIYIDVLLREAGWEPYEKNVREYPIKSCMPQTDGTLGDGFADYVLWGDNGKPLAVVEAKRTKRDKEAGREQARLYANGLERDFGQRPIVFYSNGYETGLWDDKNYPPRSVFGFYTKEELELLIQRRTSKKSLANETINLAITERPYQQEAIRRVAEALERKQRDALLIMATGTGKTRVAASIVDFLSKANWVKRVLFLADRIPLVEQAKKSFNTCLPNLPGINLVEEKEDDSSRIVFSTYQTLINLIDGEMDGDSRFYGVGHFDLIIFDEIHRSVYNRYKAIFKYFDGIRIGLTATPKTETSKDTYELFGMEANNPTFAYELDEAVRDGFLVPPVGISVPTKFHREGIKYSELSEEEKEEYEEKFSDPITEELFVKEIESSALNDWLFNTNTVDQILSHIMRKGIKVEGGDKLAKTIIFARSHSHAKFIEERFNEQFKQYKGEFLRVIDYQEEQRKSLLELFKDNKRSPQIAVSVDMLDTGIDVPEVCNLVFYKPVKSLTKFWQMVGRGTRPSKNLFGHGLDKKEFLIFDFCENFEFFEVNPKGIKTNTIKSVSQRLFELRLRLMVVLSKEEDSVLKDYSDQILNRLIGQTQALDLQSFIVRQHLQTVEKYRDPSVWKDLSDLDIKEIFDHIAPIVLEADTDELAKRFDLILLDIQLKTKTGEKAIEELTKRVRLTASKLSKKGSIPKVAEKMDIIRNAQEENFWKGVEIPIIEKIRIELRSLIQFLDSDSTNIVTTHFEDEIGEGTIKDLSFHLNDLDAYKRKVERYLKENNNHTTIYKIRNNLQITETDIKELERMLFDQGSLGTKEQFVEAYGEQPLGRFIRSIVGLEAKVAKELFGKILGNQTLNARQIKFMDTIINYLSIKGVIDPALFFEPPFTDISSNGISDVFDDSTTDKIISLLDEINKKAEAA